METPIVNEDPDWASYFTWSPPIANGVESGVVNDVSALPVGDGPNGAAVDFRAPVETFGESKCSNTGSIREGKNR